MRGRAVGQSRQTDGSRRKGHLARRQPGQGEPVVELPRGAAPLQYNTELNNQDDRGDGLQAREGRGDREEGEGFSRRRPLNERAEFCACFVQ